MELWKRGFLKLISAFETDVTENYPRMRRSQELLQALGAGKYDYADWEIERPSGDPIPVRLFPYNGSDQIPGLIIFIHGGGWVTGSIDSYTRICGLLAETLKRTVCSIDYRLAPEYPYPAGLTDCIDVVKRIFAHAPHAGLDPDSIVLAGDSAGGNLCASTALYGLDMNVFKVRRMLLMYPTVAGDYHDVKTKTQFPSLTTYAEGYGLTLNQLYDYIDLYLHGHPPKPAQGNPRYLAPLTTLSKEGVPLSYPETLVITAELDILRDEGEAFADLLRAKATAYRISEAIHGFLALPAQMRPVQVALTEMEAFLEQTEKIPEDPYTQAPSDASPAIQEITQSGVDSP